MDKIKILIVEDEAIITRDLQKRLETQIETQRGDGVESVDLLRNTS